MKAKQQSTKASVNNREEEIEREKSRELLYMARRHTAWTAAMTTNAQKCNNKTNAILLVCAPHSICNPLLSAIHPVSLTKTQFVFMFNFTALVAGRRIESEKEKMSNPARPWQK